MHILEGHLQFKNKSIHRLQPNIIKHFENIMKDIRYILTPFKHFPQKQKDAYYKDNRNRSKSKSKSQRCITLEPNQGNKGILLKNK